MIAPLTPLLLVLGKNALDLLGPAHKPSRNFFGVLGVAFQNRRVGMIDRVQVGLDFLSVTVEQLATGIRITHAAVFQQVGEHIR